MSSYAIQPTRAAASSIHTTEPGRLGLKYPLLSLISTTPTATYTMLSTREKRQYRILKLAASRQRQSGPPEPSPPSNTTTGTASSPLDKATLRQLKNRESAIRSRKRKDELIEQLSARIEALERENHELRSKVPCTGKRSRVEEKEGTREHCTNFELAS